ncbi:MULTISPECIES: prolipoprotein diacylglyceryl transferase family protein [Clostridium]|nr:MULTISPECIES: prolipoprotein diacylglyceryl transferase family protein [Clostridium]
MANIMIWGINYNGQLLHPAQVYEFILDYILFIVLWRRSYKKKFEGELFIIYLIAFAIIRGIVEFFRINPVIWGPFSISHLLSLALVIIGLAIYIFLSKRVAGNDRIYVEENKVNLTSSIIILIALVVISVFVFYFVQG